MLTRWYIYLIIWLLLTCTTVYWIWSSVDFAGLYRVTNEYIEAIALMPKYLMKIYKAIDKLEKLTK